ncbi:MAG: 2-oxoglutarate and iron-dependent oxygenase domain-containing protein [Pseudomonadota bacterium]
MIPVLSLEEFAQDRAGFAATLGRTCRDTGFFLLKGHGVPTSLIDDVFAKGKAFFDQPDADKNALAIAKIGNNRGYAALGTERLDETSALSDRKEAFNIGLDLSPEDPRIQRGEPFRGVNAWPDVDGFRETLLDYFDAVWALGVTLHRPLALDLGLPEHWFAPHLDAPMATLRLLSYPGDTAEATQTGAGAHTDYGSLTLLMTDGVPGLQVRTKAGDWIDVPHVDGAFVVNIGDCLMRWSNDTYVSTPHRVLPPPRARMSIAFFLDPNPDAMIEALPGTGAARYGPVTAAEYLAERLNATYGPKNRKLH